MENTIPINAPVKKILSKAALILLFTKIFITVPFILTGWFPLWIAIPFFAAVDVAIAFYTKKYGVILRARNAFRLNAFWICIILISLFITTGAMLSTNENSEAASILWLLVISPIAISIEIVLTSLVVFTCMHIIFNKMNRSAVTISPQNGPAHDVTLQVNSIDQQND